MGLTWHGAAFTGEEGRLTELEQTGGLVSGPSGLSRRGHGAWDTLVQSAPRINGGCGRRVSVQRLELRAGVGSRFRARSRQRVAHTADARSRRRLPFLTEQWYRSSRSLRAQLHVKRRNLVKSPAPRLGLPRCIELSAEDGIQEGLGRLGHLVESEPRQLVFAGHRCVGYRPSAERRWHRPG